MVFGDIRKKKFYSIQFRANAVKLFFVYNDKNALKFDWGVEEESITIHNRYLY